MAIRAEMAKFNLYQSAPVVTYDLTVHGVALKRGVTAAAVCTDCHGSHDLHKSTNPASKLYWQNVPDTCGKCHENVKNIYERSVHGKAVARGVRDAPVCTDCHGEHTIQAVTVASSKVSAAHIPETCGHCHGSVRIASQYQMSSKVVETMESFHGLVEQFGETTVANCASCHGFHDVLPPSDPLSSVNPKNLPQTCGKCHALVGTLMRGEIHNLPGAEKGKPWLVNFIALFFNVIIVLTIGGMLAFNALDYVAKTRAHLRKVRESADSEVLLSKWTRYQHLGVTILFIILAYTGFAHKYPDAFFSWPFKLLKNGEYMRGMIHRITGCAFAGLFFVQLVALCCTRPGQALRQRTPVPVPRPERRRRPTALQHRPDQDPATDTPLELRPEGRVLGAGGGIVRHDRHRRDADLQRNHSAHVAEYLGRRGSSHPFLRSFAGYAGHRRLAILLGHLPPERGLVHRQETGPRRTHAGTRCR